MSRTSRCIQNDFIWSTEGDIVVVNKTSFEKCSKKVHWIFLKHIKFCVKYSSSRNWLLYSEMYLLTVHMLQLQARQYLYKLVPVRMSVIGELSSCSGSWMLYSVPHVMMVPLVISVAEAVRVDERSATVPPVLLFEWLLTPTRTAVKLVPDFLIFPSSSFAV